jgi:hypothetical protein
VGAEAFALAMGGHGEFEEDHFGSLVTDGTLVESGVGALQRTEINNFVCIYQQTCL